MRLLKLTFMRDLRKYLEYILFSGIIFYLLFILVKQFACGIYKVPTGSMRGTIWPGDWIIAEKVSFGPRLAYGDKLYRLPGFSSVSRGDVIVFNFPEGDTVFVNNPTQNYYEQVRWHAYCNDLEKLQSYGETAILPVNYRVPYVKRCVGLPGDTLLIEKGEINVCRDVKSWQVKDLYKIYGKSAAWGTLKSMIGYLPDMWDEDSCKVVALTTHELEEISRIAGFDSIVPKIDDRVFVSTFPFIGKGPSPWSLDVYGPVIIPAEGGEIELTKGNINVYRRAIEVYEGNLFEQRNDSVFINGAYAAAYTFLQNYYFVMGDNRSFSFDSRNWGFVPEDHIIGKAILVGWSQEPELNDWKSIRWKRVGKVVQ